MSNHQDSRPKHLKMLKRCVQAIGWLLLPAIAAAGLITQSGPRLYVSSGSDTTPNSFTFTDQTGVALSSTITSAAVTITGIDTPITCSATSGTLDKNLAASFASSQSVSNNETIRARHTSSASNSTATNTVVSCGTGPVSDTFTSTTVASGGTVIFNPGDLGGYANADAIFTVDTNDHDGGISSLQNTVTRPGGSSKAIRIQYPNDEAGTQLQFPAFTATKTLYYRWWMMLDSNWSGKLPVGLKITRTFTTNNFTATVGEPGVPGDAYSSPKLWNLYLNPDTGFNPVYPTPGNPNATAFWGTNTAIMNLDIGAAFSGTPVVSGTWHLYEIYQEMNSADGVGDGKYEIRIDKATVYSSNTVRWVQSTSPRYVVNGIAGWQSMWFGGNYSGGDYPGRTTLSPTPNRYEDGYYVATFADWVP